MNFLFKAMFAFSFAAIIISCSDDDDPTPVEPTSQGNYVIGVSSGAKSYLLTTDNLKSGVITLKGNGEESNESTVYPFDNGKKGFMFLYRQGDPAMMQSCSFLPSGKLNVTKGKPLDTRTEFVSNIKNYMLAMTSVTLENGKYGEAFSFIDGNTEAFETAYLSTENIIHDGEYANMGGLVSIGDNIISALEPYKIPAPGSDGRSSESSAYPDEVNIVVMKKDGKNMKIEKILKDDRASLAVGRLRSGRLSCIGTNGDGDIYVFGTSYQDPGSDWQNPTPKPSTKHSSVVLRIKKNDLTTFDKSYFYDIEKKSDGLKLQNVHPLFDDYFLLNMFATEKAWNMSVANKFAIFNVK
ncbi:MAG: DUF4374 domain-containing protein, partial [Bacteroidaceae bacterium]